ncbi:HotDog domain-containing protein [Pavlovales sp. CCMP2436]|nr:HotDog domain-containing protein [Pavlovales sp. CCMP2436]|mmetsp:Transcript_3842/g.9707  ORF Transcript_3842/g.9707 Transcript_3842/m.9707 type:complete len:235 (-) Transcript_3842:106-810(-)
MTAIGRVVRQLASRRLFAAGAALGSSAVLGLNSAQLEAPAPARPLASASLEPPVPPRLLAPTAASLERLLDDDRRLCRLTGPGSTSARSSDAKAEFEEAGHSLIHGRRGQGGWETWDIWLDAEGHQTVAIIRFGDRLCGHRGIVHGGATAATCDELFGWTAHHCGPGKPTRIFTANLSVNYKLPIAAGSNVVVRTSLARVEGRKLYLESSAESPDGLTVYATATSLFIVARDQP